MTPTWAPTAVNSSGSSACARSPAPTASAVRPGYILFEHFGNAADGTPLPDNDRRHLWLVKADGSELRELVSDMNMGEGGHAAWAPDGIRIAFDSSDGNSIYETDVNDAAPRLVSIDCHGSSACEDRYPAYSPDGKHLAFAREIHEPAPSGVIAVRDLATGTVRIFESTRQLPPANEMGRPAWSPDGKQIAYYVVPKDIAGPDVAPLGPSTIYIVNADGTGLHALTTPGLAAGDPAWSPDGSLIVFSTTAFHEWATHGVDPSSDGHTSTLLNDGRVLTVGGASMYMRSPAFTSAELYR